MQFMNEQNINKLSFGHISSCKLQYSFNGSNTDGSFTTAISNLFLSPLQKLSHASGHYCIWDNFELSSQSGQENLYTLQFSVL